VDVLVNNAGIAWFGPTCDLDVDTYDRLFEANVRSAYFLVAAVAPKMIARGSGNIINIGSMAGQVGMAGGAAYSATKAALASFTRSWAAEYSPVGVRVNTVAPGPVYTAVQPAEQIEAIGATTIFGRAAQVLTPSMRRPWRRSGPKHSDASSIPVPATGRQRVDLIRG
jgi:NAD(P)-dependent dehydrogenase (short-subunit alcohol dehydrogenase family)